MSKNIKEKIALILEDGETLKRFEVIQRLERLINEEIGFQSAEHVIDHHDLNTIGSRAATLINEKRLDQDALGKIFGDGSAIRALCYMEATIEFLRGKKLINFQTSFKNK